MKHLLCVCLFLFLIGNGHSNAQCLNSTSFNGSLNFSSTANSIPNDMAPTGWSKNNTPDQARTGIQIDCTTPPLVASPNGGTWTRMADKIIAQEAISRTISGFTIGTSYEVTFYQSLLKNWARSSGNVAVTVGATTRYSPTIALPAASVAQTSWQSVTVGPFLATSTSMTLTLAAHSNQNGTGSSPMPGDCNGYTQNALAADLMIDGITICPLASLPLSFLSFELTSKNSVSTLRWNISDTENELGKWVVEKSTDLRTWSSLTSIEKNSEGNYSFSFEQNYFSTENYYKVTAYDKNNTPIASSVILSEKNQTSDNPCGWTYEKALDKLTNAVSGKELTVAVYDLRGNSIQKHVFGNKEVPVISVTTLQEGLYIVQTSNGQEGCSFRFVK